MASSTFSKYGKQWKAGTSALAIELWCIKQGDVWLKKQGRSLFEHYKNAMMLLWPEDDYHRWHDLVIKTYAENAITVLMGAADAGKTYPSAKWLLVEYWADPERTLGLVSSTDIRGLELRVWGAIKGLFNRARDRFPDLPGVVLESMHCITTDDIEEDDDRARVLNKGIICIPCLQGGRYTGLGKYHGIKAPRLRQLGDEMQLMSISHLDAVPNYLGKDYKAGFMGNPIDPMDPLGLVGEPEEGWEALPEPTKTTTWKTKFHGGVCVNLVGTDSPNFDYPQDEPVHYPYLISRFKLEAVAAFWGKDSHQYYSQCIGVMKTGLLARRVITRQICREHHALEKAIWSGHGTHKKIYAIDAAYSGTGGDRCVAGDFEIGESFDGIQILRIGTPVIVPVSLKIDKLPEDQIAEFVKRDSAAKGVQPEDIFYDSTGRGTLGSAFARIFGGRVPVPVEFGGSPSKRPVRHDLFVQDGDQTRHKRCNEHYLDFVTELWFSARYIIECDQMRELPEDVMKEGCLREFGVTTRSNRIFVESKHDPEARKRMVRSPDLMDWCVTGCEGARQRGFKIQKLGIAFTESEPDDWMQKDSEEYERIIAEQLLTHA